jgi:hypothetical protein
VGGTDPGIGGQLGISGKWYSALHVHYIFGACANPRTTNFLINAILERTSPRTTNPRMFKPRMKKFRITIPSTTTRNKSNRAIKRIGKYLPSGVGIWRIFWIWLF